MFANRIGEYFKMPVAHLTLPFYVTDGIIWTIVIFKFKKKSEQLQIQEADYGYNHRSDGSAIE